MGCDIHCVFQRYDSKLKEWEDIPSSYGQERNYQLFSVLAGVRRSYIDLLDPISPPRGFPKDFEGVWDQGCFEHPVKGKEILPPYLRDYWDDPDDPQRSLDMGDHSHSWLSGEEMLSWYSSCPRQRCSGVISQANYIQWDHKSPPYPYSEWVSGRGVRVVSEDEIPDLNESWTHVKVEWEEDLSQTLSFFFKEVQRLTDEYGEIRFVFGFDS